MKINASNPDLLLKALVVLAMVACLAGCAGGSGKLITIPPPPTISTTANPAIVAKNACVCNPQNKRVDVYAAHIAMALPL